MTPRRPEQALSLLVSLACLAAAASPTASSPPPATQPPPPASSTAVYLDDSFQAARTLANAAQLARQGQWTDAARLYHHALLRFGHKLIRLDEHRYTAVAHFVARQIAAWPAPGLDAYRRLYEPLARQRLQQARARHDLIGLLDLAETSFCTPSGLAAADQAAQLCIEAGRFAHASLLYRQLLDHHPQARTAEPQLMTRLLACYVLAGQRQQATRLAERLSGSFGPRKIRWQGRQETISRIVQSLLQQSVVAEPPRPPRWPVFGGQPDRNALPSATPQPQALLWQLHLQTAGTDRVASDRQPQQSPELFAVSDANLIYLQDRNHLWAIQAPTGRLAWTYRHPSAGPPAQQQPDLAGLFCPALGNGRLYACLNPATSAQRAETTAPPGPALLCLDASTGKPLWLAEPQRLAPDLQNLQLDSAPLYADRALYVVGRRRAAALQACYLMRFDANTGQLHWQRHLGSAPLRAHRQPALAPSQPCLAEGTVYIHTNLGTIAAVAAHTGRVRWLYTYRRLQRSTAPRRVGPHQSAPLALANPTLRWGPYVIALPPDASSLLLLDYRDGRLLKAVPRAELGHAVTLLGVVDGRLYAATPNRLVCYDLRSHKTVWQQLLPDPGLSGRPALTRSGLYVPTAAALQRFGLDGRLLASYRPDPHWSGGNLLPTPQQMLVVGSDIVTAYGRPQEAIARLRRRVEARPDQPGPWLDLAELACRSGQLTTAIDALRRAANLAVAPDPALKGRLFQDHLQLARSLQRAKRPQLDLAAKLYLRAARYAVDADAQVRYRLGLARLLHRQHRPAEAIQLYHQIVADPALAARPHPDGNAHRTAGQLARQRIAAIISESGRNAYRSLDRQAAELLERALKARDPQLLERLEQRFPNSLAAPKALLARARLLREDGQPRRAATLLRRALTRYQNHIDPPAIILRLVQAYLQADMPAAAALWLDRAAKRFGSYRFSYRGRSVSFSQYRQAVLPRHFAAASASPIINPPLRPAYTLDFHDRPYLLEPRFGSLPATRRDLLIIYVRGQLRAYHATSGQPAWPEPLPCRTRPVLLGYDDHHAILATAHQIFAVALDRPHIVWQRGHYPPQADDPAVDPETISTWTDHILTSRYLLSFRNRDQAVRIQTDTGQIRWRRRLDHRPAQLAAASPDFVAYIARRHNQTELVLLDATNGQTANTAPLQEVGRIVRLALACDGTVILVGSRSLLAWDPYNNRRIWQSRLDSPPRLATIQLGVDALYLSNDGCTILKYSLEDGSICWRSARLVPPGQTATFRCRLEGDRLFVLGQGLVAAVGISGGRLCWRGTIEPDTALEHFAITRRYVLAVGARSGGRPDQPSRYVAYLYDRRNDSGLIAPGGLTELGSFASFRSLHVRHRTILAVDARKVRAFTGPTRPGLQHRPQLGTPRSERRLSAEP